PPDLRRTRRRGRSSPSPRRRRARARPTRTLTRAAARLPCPAAPRRAARTRAAAASGAACARARPAEPAWPPPEQRPRGPGGLYLRQTAYTFPDCPPGAFGAVVTKTCQPVPSPVGLVSQGWL